MASRVPASVKSWKHAESRYYESPAELIAEAASLVAAGEDASKRSKLWSGKSYGDKHGSGWRGQASNWNDAVDLWRSGWPAGARKIENLRAKFDGIVAKVRERYQGIAYDVSGQWLDVGRHLAGDPESFGSFAPYESGPSSDKVLRVDVNISASGAISQDQFFWRGAAAAAFCDVAEASGLRCEIYAVSCSVFNGVSRKGVREYSQVRVKLKSANEPLDVSRIACAVADSGFYRRAIFEVEAEFGMDPGYSAPAEIRADLLPPELGQFASHDNAVVFDELHLREVNGAGGAEAFIRKSLERAGISVDGLFGD